MRIFTWTGVALLVGFSVREGLRIQGERTRANAVRVAQLRALLDGSAPKWLPGDNASRRRVWAEVKTSYSAPKLRLLWSRDGEPSVSARAFISALAEAPLEGLHPADYDERALSQRLTAPQLNDPEHPQLEARLIAALDVRLTAAFVRYARELGNLPPNIGNPAYLADQARALAKDVEQRYQTARAFSEALQRILHGKPPEDPNEVLAKPMRAPAAPAAGAQESEAEAEFWADVKDSDDPEDLKLYVEQFPRGKHAEEARRRIAELGG